MSECAFCGHPDSRHRIVDAMKERIAADEKLEEVLEDYGWTAEMLQDLGTARTGARKCLISVPAAEAEREERR